MSFDGYVRISQVGGRRGPGFIAPQVQRDTIARIAAAKGVELGEIVEERDVSDGKRVEERALGRLVERVERVERGESDGVIVWKLSRFSRSLLDAVETASRITRASGRLIAEDFDSAQPMRKAMLGLLARPGC
jgi:DNA invertase Pin-like site-specific DNA recombinase